MGSTRSIRVRRGVRSLASIAVGTVIVIVLIKMLLPLVAALAIGLAVVWLITRALR